MSFLQPDSRIDTLPAGTNPTVVLCPWEGLECNTQRDGKTMAYCQSYKTEFFSLTNKDFPRVLLVVLYSISYN